MDVRILGAVEIRAGGGETEPTSVGGPRQRRILAGLALWHDTVVSLDRLVEVTWPDEEPPAQAERNVRTYVHRIRNALPAELADRLVTQPPGYVLRLGKDELDADRLENGVAEAERLRDRRDAAGALTRIDEALREWRGAPLAEFASEAWVRGETARLDEAHVAGHELRCELLVTLDRSAAALAALEHLVDQHPFRERPRALQMRALYASGRQAEALRAFQDFRELLIDEVGVTPSQDLVDLDRAIASGGLADRAQAVRGYELHELIGTGAFADVHRGTQPALGRDVAIKSIRAELANQPDFIRGFEAEASMVARLEHPHIVPLYDFWREPDRAYLVMRWLTGGSLEASLDAGPWPSDRVVSMVDQVGGALALAHKAGVVHRDVKSANILLDEAGNAYLSDFGIAVEAAGVENPAARLSAGSPAYASPEQLRREEVGPASDIHGLAIAAFEALTGSLPFRDAPDEPTLLRHQLHDPIPAASALRPSVPAEVDQVLARATAKDPAQRQATVEEFVAEFAAAFGASVEAHPTGTGMGTATVLSGQVDNPYLGLRAFDEGDASTFFGRERLVIELVARLGAEVRGAHLIAVVGPSGSGKSSVVRAGLVPALRSGAVDGSENWFITTMTPGAHPYEALEAALLRVAVNPPASLLDQLRSERRGLIRAARRILPTDDGVALVVIDQFEELFTLCSDEHERSAFLDALAVAVTEADSPLRIVLTLRADFYDQPLRHSGFADLIKQQTVAVTPLAADELEQAITGPARAVGATFEPGLVAEVVADVAQEPGALPLMQHALRELFDARISGMMLRSTYDELGGLTGALGRRADELFHELDPGAQAATRRVFGRLVSLGEGNEDTRRRVRRTELGQDAATAAVLDAFGSARLLSFDRDPASREPTVEVAHEALIREWPRLRKWLDEDRDGLRVQRAVTDAAQRWDASGRDAGDLLRGGRLEAAAEYAEVGELTQAERALVSASVEARDADEVRARRTNRRLRRLSITVSVVAVLALVAGALALVQQQRAADERDDAEAAQAEAEVARQEAQDAADRLQDSLADQVAAREAADASRMAAEGAARVASTPQLALLLARQAYHERPGVETLGAIQRTLLGVAPGLLGYIGIADRDYVGVAFARDGEALAAASLTGVEFYQGDPLRLVWESRSSSPLQSRGGRSAITGPKVAFAVASSGRYAALATTAGLELFDVESETVTVIEHAADVSSVAFAPDSAALATGDANGTIRVWDLPAGEPRLVIDAHPESIVDLAAEVVGAGGLDPLATGDPDAALIQRRGVAALTFSADGRAVISAEVPTIKVWDAETGDQLDRHLVLTSEILAGGQDVALFVESGFGIDPTNPDVITAATRHRLVRYDWVQGEVVENIILPGQLDDFSLTEAGSAVTPDGRWSAYRSDGRVVIADPNGGVAKVVEPGLPRPASIAASHDGSRLAVAAQGGIGVIALDGQHPLADALPRQARSFEVAVSGDGRIIAHGSLLASVAHIRVDDGFQVAEGPDGLRTIGPVLMFRSSDRSLLAFVEASDPFNAQDWVNHWVDPWTGERLGSSDVANYPPEVFSSNGQWFARDHLGSSAKPEILDATTQELVASLDELPGSPGFTPMRSLTFDAPSERFMATSAEGAYRIWDTASWLPLDEQPDLGPVTIASFASAGDLVATVDRQGVITVRDAASFAPLRELTGANLAIENGGGLSWSDDSTVLLSTFDGQPRLWDIASGQQIGDPFLADDGTRQFVHHGIGVATLVGDHVLIWNVDTSTWPDVACEFAGRNMTQAEWEQFGPAGEPYRLTCPQFPPGV